MSIGPYFVVCIFAVYVVSQVHCQNNYKQDKDEVEVQNEALESEDYSEIGSIALLSRKRRARGHQHHHHHHHQQQEEEQEYGVNRRWWDSHSHHDQHEGEEEYVVNRRGWGRNPASRRFRSQDNIEFTLNVKPPSIGKGRSKGGAKGKSKGRWKSKGKGLSKSKSKGKGKEAKSQGKGKGSKSKEVVTPDTVPDEPLIRLRGGHSANEGRIEVFVDGQWGALCDDGFDNTDASVVCNQLGFTSGVEGIVTDNRFGYGRLDIVMDDIDCDGTEDKLQQCSYISDHNCGRLTEAAGVICTVNTGENTCKEGTIPGLITESTPNISLGVFGETEHELIHNLKQLLIGGNPFISFRNKIQFDIWLKDDTALANLQMIVIDVKKVWIFSNYRDKTHVQHVFTPTVYIGSTRAWEVFDSFKPNSGGSTVNGLTVIVENAGRIFTVASLKVSACMEEPSNGNCPLSSGPPILLQEGTPALAVAINDNEEHGGIPSLVQLMSGGYTLNVTTNKVKFSVWKTSNVPMSHYHIALQNVDSLKVTSHYADKSTSFRVIRRPGRTYHWSVENFFEPNSRGHPVVKLSVLFITRRRSTEFVIESFQVYACSPPDEEGGEGPTEDCYEGDGSNYRGTAATTEKGTMCINWVLSNNVNPTTHPYKGLGNHNHCRNPDADQRPWCWVADGVFGYCNVVKCTQSEDGSSTTTVVSTTKVPCTASEFECNSGTCIPDRWTCDGEEDCMYGEDEQQCDNVLDLFEHFPGLMLDAQAEDEDSYYTVTYMFTGLKECAKKCVETKDFVCRGFNYNSTTEYCVLYSVNTGLNGLTPSVNYDFYELISQAVECSPNSQFLCNNGKCIELHQTCNGIDNCNDFSDENSCAENPAIEVKLAGGNSEHEGQVLIKYMNEWGAICDDNWDIKDADVICRQLGYEGAIRATMMSEFASNSNILLDEVECFGNESHIGDCKHNNWRDHDCRAFEAAGVVCKVGKVCGSDQFACGTGPNMTCIPIKYVCDGDRDCNDGADERFCEAIEVLLLGGHSDHEGRVEIIRNGIRGTVCDDNFDDSEAQVVCRMLGYDGPALAVDGGHYGPGTGPIWLDDLYCSGTEEDLSKCTHRGWASHNCMHNEDVGVKCLTAGMTTPRTMTTTTRAPTGSTQAPPVCGQRFMNQGAARIVGGFEALYGAYPWQAGIRRRGSFGSYTHWCGGTIINNQWIVSAAHCYQGKAKEEFRLLVGDWDNEEPDDFQQEFEVEEIFTHESYDDASYDYDMAVIKLKPNQGQTIRFSENVQPACLPDPMQEYKNGTRCMVSGWGSTGWNLLGMGIYPSHLQAATVPLLHDGQCMRLYKSSVTSRMTCAGYVEGNIDSCQGDSGGPLICLVNGGHTLMGVTSWGHGCAAAYAPGVYAKVTEFLTWIQNKIDSHS